MAPLSKFILPPLEFRNGRFWNSHSYLLSNDETQSRRASILSSLKMPVLAPSLQDHPAFRRAGVYERSSNGNPPFRHTSSSWTSREPAHEGDAGEGRMEIAIEDETTEMEGIETKEQSAPKLRRQDAIGDSNTLANTWETASGQNQSRAHNPFQTLRTQSSPDQPLHRYAENLPTFSQDRLADSPTSTHSVTAFQAPPATLRSQAKKPNKATKYAWKVTKSLGFTRRWAENRAVRRFAEREDLNALPGFEAKR